MIDQAAAIIDHHGNAAPREALETARLSDTMQYRLGSYLGNPFESAVAAARLIFSGVVSRHARFPGMLVHGGGALPGLVSRMDHGWRAARAEGDRSVPNRAPSELARRLFDDTVVFSTEHLEFLVRLMGADQVVPGTDCPLEMGMVGIPRLVPLARAGVAGPPCDSRTEVAAR